MQTEKESTKNDLVARNKPWPCLYPKHLRFKCQQLLPLTGLQKPSLFDNPEHAISSKIVMVKNGTSPTFKTQ